jgi:hypothetical protein
LIAKRRQLEINESVQRSNAHHFPEQYAPVTNYKPSVQSVKAKEEWSYTARSAAPLQIDPKAPFFGLNTQQKDLPTFEETPTTR